MNVLSRDTKRLALVVALAFVLTRISHAAEWSDQTMMAFGLGLIAVVVLSFFFYDALRPEQPRR